MFVRSIILSLPTLGKLIGTGYKGLLDLVARGP